MDEAPEPHRITELEALKALAHPRRRRILELLHRRGPATSAALARELDLNTGATSYHLRELARHGLVAEVPERAHGRERWWRHTYRDLRFPLRSEQDGETRAVLDELGQTSFHEDREMFLQAQQREQEAPWSDAFPYSRGSIRVTPEQLHAFFEDYIALLNAYNPDPEEAPADARVVITRFLAFPSPPKGAEQGEDGT